MKIVVIGMGLTGACCSLTLAQAGHEVTVIDAGDAGQATTANSGSAILFQTKETELFVDMTRRSLALWDDFRQQGVAPFVRGGSHVLFANDEEEAFVARRANFLIERGVVIERLTRSEIEGRLPALHADITGSYFCAEDGEVNPYMSCIGILDAARSAGVTLQPQARCDEIIVTAGSVRGVRLQDGTILVADRVIVAAGPWTRTLAATLGTELPVIPERGEQLLTFPQPPTLTGRILSARYTRGKAAGAFVGLALGQEPDGRIKIGSTREANQDDLVTSERGRTALLDELALCFPALASLPIERHTVGIRVSSRTGKPIVAMPPGLDGVILIDGLGGNGVAFAPLIGQIARSLAEGRPDPLAQELALPPLSNAPRLSV